MFVENATHRQHTIGVSYPKDQLVTLHGFITNALSRTGISSLPNRMGEGGHTASRMFRFVRLFNRRDDAPPKSTGSHLKLFTPAIF